MDIDVINSRNLKLPNKETDVIYDSEHDAVLTKNTNVRVLQRAAGNALAQTTLQKEREG